MMDFPIVDTHLHLWDPELIRYPWLDNVARLNKAHLIADYDRARGPIEVERMVFVQCEADFAQYMKETEWAAVLAGRDPRIQGIVSWAPLEKGEAARPELEKLAANRLVKGIRRIIQFETDPEFCLRPDFARGVRMLADYDLSFDLCIKGDEQFRSAIQLARRCPEVNFILDHIGKPFIKERVVEPWKSLLKEYAGLPNAWCKMSGLVTEADFQNWAEQDLKPYIDWVMACFGWERVMYGGDWPVATQAAEYSRWVEALESVLRGATGGELKKLFHGNAIAFYQL